MITDWIHCEITSDTIEIHRGRGDEGSWEGQITSKIRLYIVIVMIQNLHFGYIFTITFIN